MAHSLSAKKRVKQSLKHKETNRARKSRVKTAVKHFEDVLASGDAVAAAAEYKAIVKKLDKTAATSTMHKKTAARKKSRLAKKLNSLTAQKQSAAG